MATTKRDRVKVLERELEDWVCRNIERVHAPGAVLVGRQVRLPNGSRLDVLSARHHESGWTDLRVIEIKSERIDGPAVLQMLGYMAVLESCYNTLGWPDGPAMPEMRIAGILAGPSISDEAGLVLGALPFVSFVRLDVFVAEHHDADLDYLAGTDDAAHTETALFLSELGASFEKEARQQLGSLPSASDERS